MSATCHDGWKNSDSKSLENIFNQDFDVNRFLYFCLRYLNKSQKMMTFGRSILYYLIESLEDLGDEFKAIGKTLSKEKPDKEVLHILQMLNELFRISYEFFYSPDRKKAMDAYLLNKEISLQIDSCLGAKNKEITKALMSIELSRRVIYHLTTMRLDTLKELGGD
jgi:hypothetical protein